MSKQKVRVTGLELETKDGKKVSLTLAEAKELHEQLDELFGKEVQYIPSKPIYVRLWWDRPYYPYVYCSTNGGYQIASNSTGMSVTYENGLNTAGQ